MAQTPKQPPLTGKGQKPPKQTNKPTCEGITPVKGAPAQNSPITSMYNKGK